MLRHKTKRFIGVISVVNAWILIAMTIFITHDYAQTLTGQQALVPDETEIVSGERHTLSPTILEKIEYDYNEILL